MHRILLASLIAIVAACGDDATPGDTGVDSAVDDGGVDAPADAPVDAGGDGGLCVPDGPAPDPMGCTAEATDYAPGNGAYEPCVSDTGRYEPIEPTISTIGRVTAFEEIATLLFDPTADATSEDFTNARLLYQEDEGLDSRMVRRYDPHFTVPDGTDCTIAGVPEMYPDYCVGPAVLQPIVLDALNAGIAGDAPRESAGRVEGALLWFLYVSTFKESLTCTTTAKDCDSSWAYYTGGEPARCGIGLSRYVAETDPYAHDRAWDGVLAVRCWRDIDPEVPATDLALRDQARAQYDRAVLHGVAQIVKRRLGDAAASSGDEQSFHWGSATVLGRALDREMTERSTTDAMALREELGSSSAAEADIDRAIGAIDAVFDCP
jgi:hypothetical protein